MQESCLNIQADACELIYTRDTSMTTQQLKLRDGPDAPSCAKQQQSSATDKPPTGNSRPKRLSLSLSADAAGLLEQLAETQGISQNEVIRRSLMTEAYIQQEIQQGSRILIQKADDEIREVVFR